MKKTYEIPSVEMTQLMPGTIVLAGSPPVITGGGNTEDSGSTMYTE